jgi:LacI family transcriptional regulator
VQPALSSVRLDFQRIGYEAAALLDQLMDGAKAPAAPRLIVPEGVATRASTDVVATGHPVIARVLALMRERLRDSLGVEEFARMVGVSKRTLEALFQRELGEGVHRTLLKLRLRQARRQLERSDHTVEAIALEAGFCHAPHLYREFKRWTGKTPSQWRESLPSPIAARR